MIRSLELAVLEFDMFHVTWGSAQYKDEGIWRVTLFGNDEHGKASYALYHVNVLVGSVAKQHEPQGWNIVDVKWNNPE